MNTASKPFSSSQYGASKTAQSDTLSETARSAYDSVSSSVGDAVDRGQAAVSQAGAKASEMAELATQQMKSLTSELEDMARRNPLGMLAGALMTGVLIGLFARGRG